VVSGDGPALNFDEQKTDLDAEQVDASHLLCQATVDDENLA
jgi:hypothetical protein